MMGKIELNLIPAAANFLYTRAKNLTFFTRKVDLRIFPPFVLIVKKMPQISFSHQKFSIDITCFKLGIFCMYIN